MFKFFKRTPTPPPPPPPVLTEEEKEEKRLVENMSNILGWLSHDELVYFWGLVLHNPSLLTSPDPVTAAALASIQMKIGVRKWEKIINTSPKILEKACVKTQQSAYSGGYY